MAQAASLAQLQAETSCPICLDYLQDPVTTDCGHNFCHSCILQRWEDLQGDFPCPVCLQHCPDRSLRRNTQLCHMVDVVKQLPNTEGEGKQQEEKPLCEKHHQVLSLFCEEDLELLCPQCQVSCDHQDHHLVPMEQAAACHRKRLKGSIEPLKKQLEEADMALDMQVSKSYELLWRVEHKKRNLHRDCSCDIGWQMVYYMSAELQSFIINSCISDLTASLRMSTCCTCSPEKKKKKKKKKRSVHFF
uniref:Tripartite motif containing 61 n=1 Tax=Sus scrofa TaxID=9823 RepID=A0A4X1U7B6_PIG